MVNFYRFHLLLWHTQPKHYLIMQSSGDSRNFFSFIPMRLVAVTMDASATKRCHHTFKSPETFHLLLSAFSRLSHASYRIYKRSGHYVCIVQLVVINPRLSRVVTNKPRDGEDPKLKGQADDGQRA